MTAKNKAFTCEKSKNGQVLLDGKNKIQNETELTKSAGNQQRAKADPTLFF
jgi:hypothetical protein